MLEKDKTFFRSIQPRRTLFPNQSIKASQFDHNRKGLTKLLQLGYLNTHNNDNIHLSSFYLQEEPHPLFISSLYMVLKHLLTSCSGFVLACLIAFTVQVYFFSPISPVLLELPPPSSSSFPQNNILQVKNSPRYCLLSFSFIILCFCLLHVVVF